MEGLILAAAVLAVIALAVGLFMFLNPSRTAADRVRDLTGSNTSGNEDAQLQAVAERLAKLANSSNEEEQSLLRLKMIQGGYMHRNALEFFNAIRVIAAIGAPVVLVPIFFGGKDLIWTIGGVVVLAAAGYYIPQGILDGRVAARQKRLLAPFPDSLDLLVTSVEAGLGLDAAFRRVAEELKSAAPELSWEYMLVNQQTSAGMTRIEALKNLEKRTGLAEVKQLVNMLTQSERFGTSIARSLRVHSENTRALRMARAEEEAAKVSPKLTVVMILFLLPCLIVVLLGPAVVQIKNNLLF
jgi:tight adherence protein C